MDDEKERDILLRNEGQEASNSDSFQKHVVEMKLKHRFSITVLWNNNLKFLHAFGMMKFRQE